MLSDLFPEPTERAAFLALVEREAAEQSARIIGDPNAPPPSPGEVKEFLLERLREYEGLGILAPSRNVFTVMPDEADPTRFTVTRV